ncbi:unnamed protein product [Coffea canephora]|uniref:PGG domain-containing protein n=1 Tax=Coffea canephora TaxID=49390 RepID=A0A068V6Z0_COFCA|nr:unnamed protein product [Coffea canephora]
MHPDLYRAAQSGNWDEIQKFANKLYSQRNAGGNSVLHVVAWQCSNSADAVTRILEREPRLLLIRNDQDETALHLAASMGRSYVVQAIMGFVEGTKNRKSRDKMLRELLGARDRRGNTALHEAVRNNFYEAAKVLVEADRELRYRVNFAGESPLYLAVENENRGIAILILSNCESPSYDGPDERTALHAAALCKFPECEEVIKLMLEKLPEVTKKVDKIGWTALHCAAKFDRPEGVRLLVSKGKTMAYVYSKRRDSYKTALHIAVISGSLGVIREILNYCPDCWEAVTKQRQNILHLAVKNEHHEVLEFILRSPWAGHLINRQDHHGNTPLHLYVATERLDGQNLVSHPALNLNAINEAGLTPLGQITESENLTARQILIKDELEQAGGTRGYRNVATVKKILQAASPDEVKRVEKLSKNYSIVATLIATVTFAAVFQVPGGYNSDGPHKGMAVLGKKAAFIAFVILDSLAMFASIVAVVGHIMLMVTKNYRLKLAVVLAIVVEVGLALEFMTMAFITGLVAVLPNLTAMILLCAVCAWLGLHLFIWTRFVGSPTKFLSSLLCLHSHMLQLFARKRGQGMYLYN